MFSVFRCETAGFSAVDLNKDVVVIQVKENQNIRDIANDYIGDPDGWVDILRANHLTSPHEIRPGMILTIPVKDIMEVKKSLIESKEAIQRATSVGAKIFAPEAIANAIQLYERAIEIRKNGGLQESLSLATASIRESEKAYNISIQNQDVPAEAVVQNIKGNVHSKKASEALWKPVSKFDILIEGDRIRTLSQSTADILFRDESMLHLKENAQALIQKMRTNLLDESGDVKVNLIKGDVFALLAGGSKNKGVKVEIPGVQTKINSQEYWVSRDTDGAKIANYEGQIEITSAGSTVVLQKNQGSVVPNNQQPSPPLELLSPPELISPKNNEEIHQDPFYFRWENVQGASAYLIEIAKDSNFSTIIHSEVISDATMAKSYQPLQPGLHHWRVIAISKDKLPGRSSKVYAFKVIKNQPPFLVVQSPLQQYISYEKSIEVTGQTEIGVNLTIQGKPVKVTSSGSFVYKIDLTHGENTIQVKATNPYGYSSEINRTVMYYPPDEIYLTYDPSIPKKDANIFLTPHNGLTLIGKTVPNATVFVTSQTVTQFPETIRGVGFSASTFSDTKGNFQINIQTTKPIEHFEIMIQTLNGNTRKEQFTIQTDTTPPTIEFLSEIPSHTSQKKLTISGIAKDTTYLYMNGNELHLNDEQFMIEIGLTPGNNSLRFEAFDLVNNLTVIEKKIIFDAEPPQFIESKIVPFQVKGGEKSTIMVHAVDTTGLAKAAPYTISIGTYSHSDVLILTPQQTYMGSFHIPNQISGKVILKSITLSDPLGNRKIYEFGN